MAAAAPDMLHPSGCDAARGALRRELQDCGGLGLAREISVRGKSEGGIPEPVYREDANGRAVHRQEAAQAGLGGGREDVPLAWFPGPSCETDEDALEGAAVHQGETDEESGREAAGTKNGERKGLVTEKKATIHNLTKTFLGGRLRRVNSA